MARITEENENMLKRLQEKQSCYNVFDWEMDRKKQVKMLKKICYYPPSLSTQKPKRRGKKRNNMDPNYEVFQYYQNNLKQSGSQESNEGMVDFSDPQAMQQYIEMQRT